MPLAWNPGGDFLSVGRLNMASLHQMSGAEFLDLVAEQKQPGMKIYILEDAPDGSVLAGHYYTIGLDGQTMEIEGLTKHSHTSDQDGGAFTQSVLLPNLSADVDCDKRFARSNAFWITTASGGSVTDDAANSRIVLDTSATSSGLAQIRDGGARAINLGFNSGFEVNIRQDQNTNFKTKIGVGAEDINASNTNTEKYGFEGCSSSGTVWLIFSANGGTRSTLATTSAVSPGTSAIYRVECEAGLSVTLYVNSSLSATKSSNVPSTGTSGRENVYKAGIQNTAAQQKILWHYGGQRVIGSA